MLWQVLAVVYRPISSYLLIKADATRTTGYTGAVTPIQRFGSAPNLNVHFHMIFVDGVYLTDGTDPPLFGPVRSQLHHLMQWLHGVIIATAAMAQHNPCGIL